MISERLAWLGHHIICDLLFFGLLVAKTRGALFGRCRSPSAVIVDLGTIDPPVGRPDDFRIPVRFPFVLYEADPRILEGGLDGEEGAGMGVSPPSESTMMRLELLEFRAVEPHSRQCV